MINAVQPINKGISRRIVTAQVIRDEKRNLFLHINETPIAKWFMEQLGLSQKETQRKGNRFKPIPFLVIGMYFCYFLSFSIGISFKFTIFAHGFRICTFSKTYCSIVTQSPPLKYEQTFIIGTATQTGAAFPYLKVVCGEPCDVWRMSAPLLLNMGIKNGSCG